VGLLVDNAVAVMDHPEAASYDLHSLRSTRVSSFVKKLNQSTRDRWRELTGAVMIEAAWGMTETHTCDTFTTGQQTDDFDLKLQPIFVGLPVPGTVARLGVATISDTLTLSAAPNPSLIQSTARPALAGIRHKTACQWRSYSPQIGRLKFPHFVAVCF